MLNPVIDDGKSVNSNSRGSLFIYIVIVILLLTILIFIFKNVFADKRTSDASVLKNELYLNEDLVYTDNTDGARTWRWEFGDGGVSTAQSGAYHYVKTGSYIVRLTIDGDMKVQFPVTVKDTVTAVQDTAVTINGPTSGIVNEEVRLEAEGKGAQFEWSFGETGRVDVNGRTALYTFRKPGTYVVRLTSDRSHPVSHVMYITDPGLDTVLVVPGEGERRIIDDIRARLQAIADGEDFNTNYYYLINKYLCGNEKVTVAIEQDSTSRKNDFYTYCMRLTFGKGISIDQAQLTISPNASCATLLNIKQHTSGTANK